MKGSIVLEGITKLVKGKTFALPLLFLLLLSLGVLASNTNIGKSSLDTSHQYTGEYKIVKQSGNESFYDDQINKSFVLELQNVTDVFTNVTNKKNVSVTQYNICFVADFDEKEFNVTVIDEKDKDKKEKIETQTYSVPSSFKTYKNKDYTKEDKTLSKELKKLERDRDAVSDFLMRNDFETGDTQQFCTVLDPRTDFHFRFGDASIELEQETLLTTDVYLENVTAEPKYTHLNISKDEVVVFMPFDQDNTTHTYDYTKYNNDGSVAGAQLSPEGHTSQAFYFDGTNDYIDMVNSKSNNITDTMTMSAWVQVNNTKVDGNHNQYVLDKQNKYGILVEANEAVSMVLNGAVVGTTTETISLDAWHHIGATYNKSLASNQGKVFIDGVNVQNFTSTASVGTTTFPLRIGCYSNSDGACSIAWGFNGFIDEVIVMNTSIRVSEMMELYQQQHSLFINSGRQTFKSFPLNLTDENVLNITVEGYERFNGTNISLEVGDWNYTDGYDDTDTDLLLSLHFDNRTDLDETNTFFIDSGPYKNNGSSIGFDNDEGVDARYHKGISLDGTNDYINFGDLSAMEGIPHLTMSLWMYSRDLTTNYQGVFLKRNIASGLSSIEILHGGSGTGSADDLFMRVNSGSDAYGYSTSNILKLNTWQHVVMVYDGTLTGNNRVVGYVDGVSLPLTYIGTSPTTTPSGTGSVHVGNVSGIYKNGIIDEIKLYNRSLSAEEVKSLYVGNSLNFTYNNLTSLTNTTGDDNISFNEFTVRNSSTEFQLRFNLTSNANNSYSPTLGDANITLGFEFVPPPPVLGGAGENVTSEPIYHHLNLTDNNVILYMPFDSDNASNTYDYSLNNADGTLTGGLEKDQDGIIGSSYNFDGINDVIDIGEINWDPDDHNYTISFWYNGTEAGVGGTIRMPIFSYDDGASIVASLSMDSGKIVYPHYNGSWNYNCETGETINDGVWHHVVYSHEQPATGNFYIDGVLNETCNDEILYVPNDLFRINRIMYGQHSVTDYYTEGKLDSVSIFNRTLNPTEVDQLYNSTFSLFPKSGEMFYKSNPINVTTEDRINYTIQTQSVENNTNAKIVHNWWNYTKGYNDTDTDLVLSMHFDNRTSLGENNTLFIDSTAQKNNATSTGFEEDEGRINEGRYHGSLKFDGIDDVIQTVNNISIVGSNAFSASLWFKPESSTGRQTLFCWGTGTTANQFCPEYNGAVGNPNNIYVVGFNKDFYTTETVPINEWHHLVITTDGTTDNAQIYYNGVATSITVANSGSFNLVDSQLSIGRDEVNNRQPFNGSIDEVRFYNKTLSAEEVEEEYLLGSLLYDVGEIQDMNFSDANNNYSINNFPLDASTQEHYPRIILESNNEQSYSPTMPVNEPTSIFFAGGGAPPADPCDYVSGNWLITTACKLSTFIGVCPNFIHVENGGILNVTSTGGYNTTQLKVNETATYRQDEGANVKIFGVGLC